MYRGSAADFGDATQPDELCAAEPADPQLNLDRKYVPRVQAKLLRVLEEETFLRLGGTKPIKVDVRLVTATNTNLKGSRRPGTFPGGPVLPTQCRAALLSAAAGKKGRHPAFGTRHGAKV